MQSNKILSTGSYKPVKVVKIMIVKKKLDPKANFEKEIQTLHKDKQKYRYYFLYSKI